MKWFRLWIDILDDHKIGQLNDYEFRIFIYLLACASEEDAVNGRLTRTLPAINRRCRRRQDHFNRAIETFQKLDLISISPEGNIIINKWDKRQFKSDKVYDRVQKHRQQQAIRNVSVTVNETPPDSDSDSDTDKRKKKKEKVVFEIPSWIKKETWESYREMRQRKRAPLTNRASTLIIKELEKLRDQGNPPEDVLNESIMKSWTGVFPLSRGGDGDGSRTYRSPRAPSPQAGRERDDRSRGLGIPKAYKPEPLPVISEEERQRNLERLKQLTK